MKDKLLHLKLDTELGHEEKAETDTQKFNIKLINIFF